MIVPMIIMKITISVEILMITMTLTPAMIRVMVMMKRRENKTITVEMMLLISILPEVVDRDKKHLALKAACGGNREQSRGMMKRQVFRVLNSCVISSSCNLVDKRYYSAISRLHAVVFAFVIGPSLCRVLPCRITLQSALNETPQFELVPLI